IRSQFPRNKISFIAHSFGTYVVAEFLRLHRDFKVWRLILCGSVLPRGFQFLDLASNFPDDKKPDEKIVNDCGTHDICPIFANRVTRRYGASGTFGFFGTRVRNRWHNYMRHSDFLTEPFCREYWIPFLENGTCHPGARRIDSIPRYMSVLSRLPIKLGLLL